MSDFHSGENPRKFRVSVHVSRTRAVVCFQTTWHCSGAIRVRVPMKKSGQNARESYGNINIHRSRENEDVT